MSVQGCFVPEGSSLGFSAIVDSIAATRLGWRWDLRGPGCAELHSALLLPLKPRVYLLELFLLDEVTLGRAKSGDGASCEAELSLDPEGTKPGSHRRSLSGSPTDSEHPGTKASRYLLCDITWALIGSWVKELEVATYAEVWGRSFAFPKCPRLMEKTSTEAHVRVSSCVHSDLMEGIPCMRLPLAPWKIICHGSPRFPVASQE